MWSPEAHFCVRWLLSHVKHAAALCREEGMAGLWKGVGPNVARNAIINAAELASYDQVLHLLDLPGLHEMA